MEQQIFAPVATPVRDQQGWGQVRQRLEQLVHAATARDHHEPRSVLLLGPTTSASPHELDVTFQSFVQSQQGHLLELSCLQAGPISFWAVQRLLDLLAPVIIREQPDLLNRFGVEINAIHPDLAKTLGIKPELSLDQVALTPSERRSHRESEQAFRVINGICSLVIEAQQSCPSFSGGPLVIWWKHLHNADRPSLLTFRRLSRWIGQAHAPLLLIGSLDPDADPTLGAPELPPEIQRYFDWRAEHRQLLQTVRSQLLSEEITVLDDEPVVAEQFTFAPVDDIPISELNGSRAMLLALSKFQQGCIEEACAYALHAMRLAVFALNCEGILLLGQYILGHLEAQDEQHFATERFSELWQRLSEHGHYAALEFAAASIQRRQDIIMATWKAAGLAQTFLEHHQAALECYQRALALADSPAMRAQLYMYMGLMSGKRLRNRQQAQEYLQQGFREIEEIDDMEAGLERGWLFNVSALMTYHGGRYNDAMTMVRNALTTMKPFHQGEATYLKINLVSNMSVLLEDSKQYEQAIEVWSFFQNLLSAANEVFAKHYFFREGGLRLLKGDQQVALESYRRSYEYAQANDDGFHMEVVARASGYVSYQLGLFDEAHRWFAQSAALRNRIGDYEHVPESLSAQALCMYRLGQLEAAQELLRQSEQLCLDLKLDQLTKIQEGLRCLEQREAEALDEWGQQVLRLPDTKLNRPFHLINLYR